jgi:GT2 family glycosyltransferase
MILSYVIVTRNRRAALLQTLARLERNTGLGRDAWETIVVDNASDDGSAQECARAFPDVRVVRLGENEGMPARNHGFRAAGGRYVCMLDDDSYPTGDAIPMSVQYLDQNPRTAAVVGRVELPGGGCEGAAMPCVLLGGASVVRRSVLDQTGGFTPEFFRQAEEYDLSFRILALGWRIERFEDVVYRHEKVPGGRGSALVHRMDLRNNLIVARRYLPEPLRSHYWHDWLRRYAALARQDGCADAAKQGLAEARAWAPREWGEGLRAIDLRTLESIFGFGAQANAVAQWKQQHGVRRVAIADFSKNVYATYAACGLASLEVAALVDDRPAFSRSNYRGMPIVPGAALPSIQPDGVIVSNTNPAQVGVRAGQVRRVFGGPVLTLWRPSFMNQRERDAALAA